MLDSVKTIVAALLRARSGSGLSTYNTFDTFLSVCEAALLGYQGVEWKRVTSHVEHVLPDFQYALGELMYSALQEGRDLLGPCYMTLGKNDASFSQFLTPWSAAYLLAEVLTRDVNKLPATQSLYILDSACGSGTLLLAIAYSLQSSASKLKVLLAGLDIDPLCIKMTRLNLHLHGFADLAYLIKEPKELTADESITLATALHV